MLDPAGPTVPPDSAAGERLRIVCLALPEAYEKTTWGAPTYRVRRRIFAMERHDDGRTALWCKAPRGVQRVLVEEDPARWFAPPYVGPKGWIGMWIDDAADWDEVDAVVRRSYLLIAPKRLGNRLL